MKTAKQLIAEVDAELNAVRAADMGLEAAEAFAQDALNQFEAGDVLKAREGMQNMLNLLGALRKAVPANVIPASAGPVGKSPKEHMIEQAAEASVAALEAMKGATERLQSALADINSFVGSATQAIGAGKALKDASKE